jgi:hypothetical protein
MLVLLMGRILVARRRDGLRCRDMDPTYNGSDIQNLLGVMHIHRARCSH